MCKGNLPPSVEVRIAAAQAAGGDLRKARALYRWMTEGVDMEALDGCQNRGKVRAERAAVLNKPVADVFGHRVETALDRAGIRYVGQACATPEEKLKTLPGIGATLLGVMRSKLDAMGLRLGMSTADLSAWVNRT